jgi:glycosyltransferase involved in cell wall biosynthesis
VHVVAVATDRSPGAAYRGLLPMQALAEHGHQTDFLDWDMRTAPPPFEDLRRADVVHFWRLYRAPARRLMSALKEAGVGVVFDNDDDMTRVPKGSPAYAEMKRAREQVAQELSATLRLAHLVTTTGGELAGRLRRLGGDVRVVENYLEPGFLRPQRTDRDGVTIGWVAGGEHRGDLKELRLRRTLEQLLETQPHVRLVGIGLDLGLRSDRYTHRRLVSFSELPEVISQFDVGLAPIADVSFNRVRSNIKVKEYAAAGVPWLASPIGPYKGLGEEQGGRLVADHRWAEELTALVTDADARERLAAQAAAWGRTQTVPENVEQWEAVFTEAAERAGRSVGDSSVRSAARRRNSTMVIPRPSVPVEPGAASQPAAGAERDAQARTAGGEPAPRERRGLFRRRRDR